MTSKADTDPHPRAFISGLGIAQIASWGSLYYSFPQIAEAMSADLGFTKASLYGAATMGVLLSGLAVYPVGVAIDRGWGRIVMAGASALAGLLLLAWSQVETLTAFFLIVAGIGLLQAATLYEPAFAVVVRRFGPLSARRRITELTLWGGFASTVFIPVIEGLIAALDWRGALVGLAIVNLGLCTSLYGALINPARDHRHPVAAEPAAATGRVRHAVREPVYWLLGVSLTLHAGTFSLIAFHLYPLLMERGLAPASVVAVMAVIGPAQVAGRIAVRTLAPEASAASLGSLAVIGFPVAMMLLCLPSTGLATAAIAAAMYGAANGVMTIVRGSVVPEMVSREGYGALNGALNAPSLIARALAPVAGAALWTLTGSYTLVVTLLLVGAALHAVIFWVAVLWSRQWPATAMRSTAVSTTEQ
jgi:MFS family permease